LLWSRCLATPFAISHNDECGSGIPQEVRRSVARDNGKYYVKPPKTRTPSALPP
jgi:hypothetical protein